jgi:hypothetical protein
MKQQMIGKFAPTKLAQELVDACTLFRLLDRQPGPGRTIRAGYLVGADGARSRVRETPAEQAKVDILRADWERRGSKAMEDFIQTEISLCLKAMDHIFGREVVADTLREVITEA